MGQCSFLLTVLAFRCIYFSAHSQIDIGCRRKMVVAGLVLAKNTFSLGTHPPTQLQEVCQRHLSKTNSHHLTNASNQNNQSTQTGVKKFSSPKRTPTRHSEAKDFSVWRQTWFIIAPKTGSTKRVERWRPERDLDCISFSPRPGAGVRGEPSYLTICVPVNSSYKCKFSWRI